MWWVFWVYAGFFVLCITSLGIGFYRFEKTQRRKQRIREWREKKLERNFNRIYGSVIENNRRLNELQQRIMLELIRQLKEKPYA